MPLVWHFISLPVFERSQTTFISNLGVMVSFSLLLFCSFKEERGNVWTLPAILNV